MEIINLDMDSLSLSHHRVSATLFYFGKSHTVSLMLQNLCFSSIIKSLTFNSLFIKYETTMAKGFVSASK